MTANLCIVCTRPEPDAYVCPLCASRAAEWLTEVAEVTPAARDVAQGLSRRSQGGGSGKPGSRLPFDLGATSRLDAVQASLTGWVDHIGTTRGATRPWFEHQGDPIAIAAQWLTSQLEWIRHRAPDADGLWGADQFLTDVDACARVVRGIARGPSEQRFLGPCGEPLIAIDPDVAAEHGIHPANAALGLAPCDGDVYAYRGAQNGTCRACGAKHSAAERQAWLDGEVRQRAFTARDIADAYGINVKTIRSWAERGTLAEHGRDWESRPLYLVGDVLDLAAGDAARRAERESKRARAAAVLDTAGQAHP